MEDEKKKDGLVIALGMGPKKGEGEEEEESEGVNHKELAEEMLSAIKDDDADALAKFLKNIM
jgi:hypothetical protein